MIPTPLNRQGPVLISLSTLRRTRGTKVPSGHASATTRLGSSWMTNRRRPASLNSAYENSRAAAGRPLGIPISSIDRCSPLSPDQASHVGVGFNCRAPKHSSTNGVKIMGVIGEYVQLSPTVSVIVAHGASNSPQCERSKKIIPGFFCHTIRRMLSASVPPAHENRMQLICVVVVSWNKAAVSQIAGDPVHSELGRKELGQE